MTEDVPVGSAASFGLSLTNPEYTVEAQLVPRLEIEIGVDLGVYDWDHTFGPYDIDELAISLGNFKFTPHAGTPNRFNYTNIGSSKGR